MKFAWALCMALTLGACASGSMSAPATSADSRDCFQSARVYSFDPVDDTHVRISISPARRYLVTTMSSMRTADWTRPLVFDAPPQVCVGDVSGVKLIGGEPRREFIVTHIERVPETQPEGS